MDPETESSEKPTVRPPDLSVPPPNLSQPVLSPPPSFRPPDLSGPVSRPPDLAPPTSVPAPASKPVPSPAPASSTPPPTSSFGPPTIPIPEEAKKKPRIVEPDEDEVKAGDLAPFNPRVVAAAIDCAVSMCLYIVLAIILPASMHFIGSLVSLAYLFTRDSIPFFDGQSIGKKVMKLKALTLDDKPLTGDWKTGVIRNIPMIIAPIELVVLLTREEKADRGRRLGDEWAKTKVIFLGEPTPPELP